MGKRESMLPLAPVEYGSQEAISETSLFWLLLTKPKSQREQENRRMSENLGKAKSRMEVASFSLWDSWKDSHQVCPCSNVRKPVKMLIRGE